MKITLMMSVAVINGAATQAKIHHIISSAVMGGGQDKAKNIDRFVKRHYDFDWVPASHCYAKNGLPCSTRQARNMVVKAIATLYPTM